MNVKVGYPDKWIDYSTLNITKDSYFENEMAASRFYFKRDLNKIGKPVDRTEWDMTPQTVNAYYNPNMNEIVSLQVSYKNLSSSSKLMMLLIMEQSVLLSDMK